MRYYDPGTGRFTQQDSVEVLGDPSRGNRYSYAGDNPINYIDPSGRISGLEIGLGLIAAGALVAFTGGIGLTGAGAIAYFAGAGDIVSQVAVGAIFLGAGTDIAGATTVGFSY